MPCRWVTVAGRHVRLTGPVGAATAVSQIAGISAAIIAGALAQVAIFRSPRVTPEEAREASIRVWRDEERGFFAEARLRPGDPPVYTSLTPEQATKLRGPEPDPSLIAELFKRMEPVDA
jgi:hypothetical protein